MLLSSNLSFTLSTQKCMAIQFFSNGISMYFLNYQSERFRDEQPRKNAYQLDYVFRLQISHIIYNSCTTYIFASIVRFLIVYSWNIKSFSNVFDAYIIVLHQISDENLSMMTELFMVTCVANEAVREMILRAALQVFVHYAWLLGWV